MIGTPFSVRVPDAIHCHTCDREISAVAASSMRWSIAAAPTPRSHDSRYRTPTETFERSPAAVTVAPARRAEPMSSSSCWPTRTSSRCRATWFGASPSTASNSVRATSMRSGCATHVPSNPSVASRRLSARTCSNARSVTSGRRRSGMNALMPPIACAPRRWHVCTSSSVYARMNGAVMVTCARSGSTYESPRVRKALMTENR